MKAFTAAEIAELSNEWMRRFTEEPERFQAQFKTVQLFLSESLAGRTPSYGETCAAYLDELRREMAAPKMTMVPVTDEELHHLLTRTPGKAKRSRKSKRRRK